MAARVLWRADDFAPIPCKHVWMMRNGALECLHCYAGMSKEPVQVVRFPVPRVAQASPGPRAA